MSNRPILLLALLALATAAFACSDDDPGAVDAAADLPAPFTPDVQQSLPVHDPGTTKGGGVQEAYNYVAETYEEALDFGGSFDRTMGEFDPASVYIYLFMSDTVIQEVLEGDPAVIIGDGTTLTVPFLGDEVVVDHTYRYPGTYLYVWEEVGAWYVYLDDLAGGFTATDLVASFTFYGCAEEAADPPNDANCDTGHMVFYGARGDGGSLLVKSSRYQFENGDQISTGRIHYERANLESHGVLRAVSKHNGDDGEYVFSVNVSGMFDNLILRRRSYKEVDALDYFIDQFFVTSFDEESGVFAPAPLDEWSDDTAFDIDGAGFAADPVTSTETEPTYLDDVNASNMFDFSEQTVLPGSMGDLTPTDWSF